MKISHIRGIYFSPTGQTKKAVRQLTGQLSELFRLPFEETDLTPYTSRREILHFGPQDLVVLGSPVYAGRLPNKILPDFERCLCGEDTAAVPIVVYGNRSCGDALPELETVLQKAGFRILGGAALVGRHAFTDALAADRPDAEDLREIQSFARRLAERLRTTEDPTQIPPVTCAKLSPYYTPLQEDGTFANFLKAKPQRNAQTCRHCGVCVTSCPMGSIDEQFQTVGTCIKCQACIRNCPTHSRFFSDEAFLSHVRMLERDYQRRAENFFTERASSNSD